METIVDRLALPNGGLARAWTAIAVPKNVRDRLVAQCLLALQLCKHFAFEVIPVHGLIVLSGQPGTGTTTLARGLANRVAEALTGAKALFVQIDPHALASAALGPSQKEVAKLFHQIIPEYAGDGPCIVVLDEVETLAADRQRMSLEANPVDEHRATDAALAGARASGPHTLFCVLRAMPGEAPGHPAARTFSSRRPFMDKQVHDSSGERCDNVGHSFFGTCTQVTIIRNVTRY